MIETRQFGTSQTAIIPSTKALAQQRDLRATRSRRFFGIHFALYYHILYKIAIKVRNLSNPIEDTTVTIRGISYAAYSFIFKSFRLVAGVSPTMRLSQGAC